ncbi:hypothetical protein BJF93_13355 [Xaviernesmea oryzae]|uniref:Alanine racemase n=1 Tax=Xaviernesmea oryzae TaxID=464029 RepID=A0A1Q9AQW9_9HYPH|nr:hypothetical protein [Xaviernesmea oryzae]OLP57833.1 hypothetical protein BJF93_13355 [Xaviernesmea oryzae]SEL34926.1 hypothetical protein SAMN04487976_107195 [Xaviernesmea oryzae]
MDGIMRQDRMSEMARAGAAPGILTIDVGALKRNHRLLAEGVSPAARAAVLKADACKIFTRLGHRYPRIYR